MSLWSGRGLQQKGRDQVPRNWVVQSAWMADVKRRRRSRRAAAGNFLTLAALASRDWVASNYEIEFRFFCVYRKRRSGEPISITISAGNGSFGQARQEGIWFVQSARMADVKLRRRSRRAAGNFFTLAALVSRDWVASDNEIEFRLFWVTPGV